MIHDKFLNAPHAAWQLPVVHVLEPEPVPMLSQWRVCLEPA